MISTIYELLKLLEQYCNAAISLQAMHDELSLSLQSVTEKASEEDMELVSETLSAIYEVEDSVLDEESFRRAVEELVEKRYRLSTIDVGIPPAYTTYPGFLVATSTSSGDQQVTANAA